MSRRRRGAERQWSRSGPQLERGRSRLTLGLAEAEPARRASERAKGSMGAAGDGGGWGAKETRQGPARGGRLATSGQLPKLRCAGSLHRRGRKQGPSLVPRVGQQRLRGKGRWSFGAREMPRPISCSVADSQLQVRPPCQMRARWSVRVAGDSRWARSRCWKAWAEGQVGSCISIRAST